MQNNVVVRSHLALILAMVLWGSSFIALKVAVNEMDPMIVVFLRMFIGATVFLVLWPWLRHGFNYQKGDWKYLIGMTLFEPCLYFLFEAEALVHTSAGQAGMVTAMLPLMVATAAFFIFSERNTLKQWSGFFVAISGVVWMTLTGTNSEQAPNAILGNFLEFMAMATAVGYTLMVKHLIKRYSAFILTALQSFVGVLFFLPIALVQEWPTEMSLNTMAIIFYLGTVISIGAFGLFNYSLAHVTASTAGSYANLMPAVSLVFSMLLLGERLTLTQWIAICLVFVGVWLSQDRKSRMPKEIPPGATG